MNNLSEMIDKITEFLKSEAKTETIIGEPFELGKFTCVPVMSIGLGFGGGGGEGKAGPGKPEGTGSGVGAGMGMGPVGFLAIHEDVIQFIPTRTSRGLSAAFEKLPDLLEKYLENQKQEAKS